MTERILLHDLFATESNAMALNSHGYLDINAQIARSGIQEYFAIEFWPIAFEDREWDDIIRVYRPPEEVFDQKALDSFRLIPVTNDHPYEDVTASNWNDHAVGSTHGDVARDGNFVRTRLMINDAGAVNDVQRGKSELSCGYTNTIEIVSGTSPEGEPYDAISRDILGNHVAIVEKGRAGPEVKAGDARKSPVLIARLKDSCNRQSKPGQPSKDEPMSLRKIKIDGLDIEVNDAAESAIAKILGERDEARKSLSDEQAARAAETAAHTKALEGKETEIQTLKDNAPSEADLEARAQEHAALMTKAADLLPEGTELKGKTGVEIKKSVVDHYLKDQAKDFSEDQVAMAYTTLVATVQTEGTRDSAAPVITPSADAFTPSGNGGDNSPVSLEDSRKARNDRYTQAWKRKA